MTGSKGVKTNSEPRNRDRRPKKTGWHKHTMQHRGLHARSVHANSISRHYWVMVRRVFCLCCRDDMKIETSCPFSRHGICASNILFRGSWSSDDGPDLTTPVVCRVPASGRSRACGPDPGRPQNPHDACCWLFVVGCPVACFLSRSLVDSQHQHLKTTCATAPTAQRNIPTIGIAAIHSFKIVSAF